MNEYLSQPKFLGVLGHFDQRLTSQHVTDEAKEDVLQSLLNSIEFLVGNSNRFWLILG